MNLIARQLGGIIRIEFIRHWRRKGLALAILIWLVAVIWGTSLFDGPVFFQPSAELLAASTALNSAATTLNILIAAGGISSVFAILTLPVMVAETVPLDRQLGAVEWLFATPLARATYLAGKVLGVWTAVFSALIIVATISGTAHYLLLGPFHLAAFVQLWGIILAGMALFVSGMVTLLTSWLHSRRWAMFISIAFAVGCNLFLMTGFLQFISTSYTRYFAAQLPAIQADLCRMQNTTLCDSDFNLAAAMPALVPDLAWWPLRGLGIFLLTGLAAWGWQVWEDLR